MGESYLTNYAEKALARALLLNSPDNVNNQNLQQSLTAALQADQWLRLRIVKNSGGAIPALAAEQNPYGPYLVDNNLLPAFIAALTVVLGTQYNNNHFSE